MGRGLRNHREMIVAGGSLLAVTAAVLALLVMFWEWMSGGESGSTTLRNVALILVGVGALPIAIWRGIVADRQSRTAQQGLLNERYQKGSEMLGSKVLSVRLAGIYALRRLAEEHPEQYHIQVLRLFCAFVRLPTSDESLEPGQAPIRQGSMLGIRQDVESVVEAIGSRAETVLTLERGEGFRLDLRGANLSEAQILAANLSGAMFHHANLSGVNFANVDLTDALFSHADLSKARFYGVDFSGARFMSANLSNAMLQGAQMLKMDFHYTRLRGANLGAANLSGAIFQYADVSNAWLDRANLSGASFLKADLSRTRLDRADLSDAEFLDANLSGANLSGAQFNRGGPQTAEGLTQFQLDQARADPDNPPKLHGVHDTETGEQLVWREKPLCHQT